MYIIAIIYLLGINNYLSGRFNVKLGTFNSVEPSFAIDMQPLMYMPKAWRVIGHVYCLLSVLSRQVTAKNTQGNSTEWQYDQFLWKYEQIASLKEKVLSLLGPSAIW